LENKFNEQLESIADGHRVSGAVRVTDSELDPVTTSWTDPLPTPIKLAPGWRLIPRIFSS
jgi:hypothetical protein